jgi:hypothetical protein
MFFVAFIVKQFRSITLHCITLHNCITMHGTNNIKFASAHQIEHIIPTATLLT